MPEERPTARGLAKRLSARRGAARACPPRRGEGVSRNWTTEFARRFAVAFRRGDEKA
jgi:hypothetical protein